MFAAGIEYYLPLFFDQTAVITDYLPAGTLVCLHGDLTEAIERFWRDSRSRFELLRGDRDRPLLPPAELFLSLDQFFGVNVLFGAIDDLIQEGRVGKGRRESSLVLDIEPPTGGKVTKYLMAGQA